MNGLIELDKYFDKIYCINLKSRPDRLVDFKQNYKALGTTDIKIFEAVDGKKTDRGTWQYNLGALGCRLSHLAIYEEALANNYNKILIFEDDAIIHKKFRDNFTHLVNHTNDDWDMIYFGGYHHLTPDPVDQTIIKLNNTLTTHAMAINCRCLAKMIAKVKSDERWIDSVIADLQLELKVYGFKIPVATQRNGFSDVDDKIAIHKRSLVNRILSKIKRLITH